MYYYDSDVHRQCQQERMTEIRDEYRRVQAASPSRAWIRIRRYAQSVRSHIRIYPKRAPVYRA